MTSTDMRLLLMAGAIAVVSVAVWADRRDSSEGSAQQQVDNVKKAIRLGWKCRDINLSIEGCAAMAVGGL